MLELIFAQVQNNPPALGLFAAVWGLLGLAGAIISIVGLWMVFQKAGRSGWISIIPIWNTIVLMQITGRSGWWVLGYLVPLLNIYVHIRWAIEMARSFGHGVGFALGLVFLSPLFLLILGFGPDRYVGPAAKATPMVSAPA
jgi:Family of unknown function (DUF5684)